jgi:hypothetical protein
MQLLFAERIIVYVQSVRCTDVFTMGSYVVACFCSILFLWNGRYLLKLVELPHFLCVVFIMFVVFVLLFL